MLIIRTKLSRFPMVGILLLGFSDWSPAACERARRNTDVVLSKYSQTNDRDSDDYIRILALPGSFLSEGKVIADVGSGRAVAAIEFARYYDMQAIAINAQNIANTETYRSASDLIEEGLFRFRKGLAKDILPL